MQERECSDEIVTIAQIIFVSKLWLETELKFKLKMWWWWCLYNTALMFRHEEVEQINLEKMCVNSFHSKLHYVCSYVEHVECRE